MEKQDHKVDDCLSVRGGRLYMEECDLSEVANKYETPVFVVSEKQLRSNIKQYFQAFQQRWPFGKVEILPAIKANLNLATRRILTQEGAGCDVFSEGELHAALESGVSPEKISVNGGGKTTEHIRNCIKAGVRLTLDDVDELDIIEQVASELNQVAKIRFRLRPDVPNLWEVSDFALEAVPIDLGFQVYKSGIPTEHVVAMGLQALSSKNVELTGLHIHMGRHHKSLRVWRGLMQRYVKLIAQLRDEWGGYLPNELDIGGGIPTPRDPFNKMLNRWDIPLFAVLWAVLGFLRLFGESIRYKVLGVVGQLVHKTPNKKLVPTIDEYAEAITSTLKKEFKRYKIDPAGMTLQVEPGRGLYGDVGVHLSKVLKTKFQTKPIPWNWILLDTTCFNFSGGSVEYNLNDFVIANKANAELELTADICGKSCAADRLIPEVRIPKLQAGDVVAILDTGAYQEVSASNFNALPRPATLLVNGADVEVVKVAESIDDVFSRDIIPKRLRTDVDNH